MWHSLDELAVVQDLDRHSQNHLVTEGDMTYLHHIHTDLRKQQMAQQVSLDQEVRFEYHI